jgi:hypothetical protein
MPWMIAPTTWLRRPSGLTIAPHSNAAVTRRMRTGSVGFATSTSAQRPMYPPFSWPPAMPKPRPGAAWRFAQPNLSAAA